MPERPGGHRRAHISRRIADQAVLARIGLLRQPGQRRQPGPIEPLDAQLIVQQPRPETRVPSKAAASLSTLSVDIARSIDHDAAIELWRRYWRGERDVFTRRLYTLKGQQTFDEISRKYRADPEFRVAVDRYCEDFEKLLKDVARNDRDNRMSETYLTSETGKVFTMLAHAAGRLR